MKKIKINFIGFWSGFDVNDNYFTNLLRKRYEVIISDSPDYIFCSAFSNDYLKYDCIRIFYTGECVTPDFNLVDYALGFDYLDFEDRYIRFPLHLIGFSPYSVKKDENDPYMWLDNKQGFCSFVYSNKRASKFRMELFNALNQYKRVSSGGKYFNNIGGPVSDKVAFESKYKFSIACENGTYRGYTTEKICNSFEAHAIPIYWGDPYIGRVFNEKAFINYHSLGSIENLIQRVIEIDNDDKKYLEMLSQPIWSSDYNPTEEKNKVEEFIYNIFDRDIKEAKRRNSTYWGSCIYEKKVLRQVKIENVIKPAVSLFRSLKK